MARFYSNENFDRSVVEILRELGHDVLTTFEAGKANQGISDDELLSFAISQNRAVLTFNRLDFIQLHRAIVNHAGIVVCTRNPDSIDLATKIHAAIYLYDSLLENQLIRVYRGPSSG